MVCWMCSWIGGGDVASQGAQDYARVCFVTCGVSDSCEQSGPRVFGPCRSRSLLGNIPSFIADCVWNQGAGRLLQ